jgi:hypothetical protein
MLLRDLLEHSPLSQKSLEGSLDLLPCPPAAAVSLLRLHIVSITRLQPMDSSSQFEF